MVGDRRTHRLRDSDHDSVAARTGYTKAEVKEFILVVCLIVPVLVGIVVMSRWVF